jgi:cell division protein FtsB
MNRLLCSSNVLTVAILLGVIALVAIRGPQGFHALAAKRTEIRQLQEQNADLAREVDRKKNRIERLRSSQAEQELEIRERLKLMRPGETQFILPDRPKQ